MGAPPVRSNGWDSFLDIAMASSSSTLRRELGLGSAAAAVAGEAIAVGIFLTPAGMAKSLGSPFWLLVVWLTLGALTLSGALCFGELAARFPQAGGLYIYLREAYGSRIAFLYGWMSMFVMDPGITAAIAVGMAAYASYIVAWPPIMTKVVAIGAIILLCFLNILNTRIGAGLLRALTWLKFLILGILVVWALIFHLGSWSHFTPFVAQHPGSTPLLPALAGALVAAFFSFGGWWDVSKIAGEVKDPTRTLPRALVLGVLAVITAYIVVSAIFIYLVPIESVTSDQTFVAQAGAVLFGKIGADLLSGAVVICVLGTLAALIMVCPRVYYAMAKDGVFLSSVARTHPVSRHALARHHDSRRYVFDPRASWHLRSDPRLPDLLGGPLSGTDRCWTFPVAPTLARSATFGPNARVSRHADPVSAPGCRHALPDGDAQSAPGRTRSRRCTGRITRLRIHSTPPPPRSWRRTLFGKLRELR